MNHPGHTQKEINLHHIDLISKSVKFNKSKVFKGVFAKPGHLFIKTACTWMGKNHWKVREINTSILNDEQIADMFKQLKEEMINEVVNYVV